MGEKWPGINTGVGVYRLLLGTVFTLSFGLIVKCGSVEIVLKRLMVLISELIFFFSNLNH